MSLDWVQVINQLSSSGITACFTVIGGVTVLAIGQLLLKFFVEPIVEQARFLGDIAYSLTYYSNFYGNADMFEKQEVQQASFTLRKQAGQLRASAWTIRWYWLWQILGFVPKRKNIIKASENLIGLSNSMSHVDPKTIQQNQNEIKQLLRFE